MNFRICAFPERPLAGLFAAVCLNAALAQGAYPAKPITRVVQAAAGGGNDTVARRFAEKLQPLVGQPVIVDNRAGAGNLESGIGSLKRDTADLYTENAAQHLGYDRLADRIEKIEKRLELTN